MPLVVAIGFTALLAFTVHDFVYRHQDKLREVFINGGGVEFTVSQNPCWGYCPDRASKIANKE